MLGAGRYRRRIENRIRAGNTRCPDWRHELQRIGTNDVPSHSLVLFRRPIRSLRRNRGLGYQLLPSSSSPAASSIDVLSGEHRSALSEALPGRVWPADGQAAVQIGHSKIHSGPGQHAAPIASVAKVMTAYVVLRDHPLRPGQDGPAITFTDADVADTGRRRGQDESVVSIADGEQLTERQALQALLLPSANRFWRDGTPGQRTGSSPG
jgi:hypothetical protein